MAALLQKTASAPSRTASVAGPRVAPKVSVVCRAQQQGAPDVVGEAYVCQDKRSLRCLRVQAWPNGLDATDTLYLPPRRSQRRTNALRMQCQRVQSTHSMQLCGAGLTEQSSGEGA